MKNEVKNCELYCPLKVADMIEKISDKEYQASLGNGTPSKIQAVDANNNPILATPTNLLSTLENTGMIKRVFFPMGNGY